MPRRSLSGFLQRAPFLDVQTKNGFAETYSGQFTTPQNPVSDRTGTGAQVMQLLYTPPVDAWWEINGYIGILAKIDAAYAYAYAGIALTPADVDGVQYARGALTQHSQVQQYEPRPATRIFKLAAGVAYTANLAVITLSGGTWQYYCGPNELWIHGKAWAR